MDLEAAVNPDSKWVEEAAATGDDGASGPGCFVDLRREVEDREGCFVVVSVVVEEPPLRFGEDLAVFFEPVIQEFEDAAVMGVNFSGGMYR